MRGTVEEISTDDSPWVGHYPDGVPVHIDYPDEPVHWLLERAAAHSPARSAVRYFEQTLTYSELLADSRRFADALHQRGVVPGDRVGVLLPNTPEYLVALFGTWMAGGITVPLNPLMVAEEINDLLVATDCKAVVCLDLFLPQLRHPGGHRLDTVFVTSFRSRLAWWGRVKYSFARCLRLGLRRRAKGLNAVAMHEALADGSPDFEPKRPSPDAPAHILATGGTTGHPKAVTLTHRNLVANALQVSTWKGRPDDDEIMLAVLPFFHSYGMSACLLSGVAMAATLVLYHRFQAETVLELIQSRRPTFVQAVPAMLVAFNKVLRDKHYDLTSVRYCISGGAPLDPGVAKEFSDHTGAVVVEGYGLSEASPVTHVGPLDGSAKPRTIGLPLPDTDARIVDAETGTRTLSPGEVGELIVRGPQVMRGYWNDDEATALAIRDGWLFTGDLASRDEDGFFRIVDRKKDLIITSGFNVYPTDVEHVLARYPGIDDVAVLGVPDEQRGEMVKAVVVAKEGVDFDRHAFDVFIREHLAAHKKPRLIEVVPGPLPRNALGKLLRRVLRDAHGKEPRHE